MVASADSRGALRSSPNTKCSRSSGTAGWRRSIARTTRGSGATSRSRCSTRTSARAAEIAHRFAVEAKAVAKLRHPNIVEVFDVSSEDEHEQYLVVELVRGPTLAQASSRSAARCRPRSAAAIVLELPRRARACARGRRRPPRREAGERARRASTEPARMRRASALDADPGAPHRVEPAVADARRLEPRRARRR